MKSVPGLAEQENNKTITKHKPKQKKPNTWKHRTTKTPEKGIDRRRWQLFYPTPALACPFPLEVILFLHSASLTSS